MQGQSKGSSLNRRCIFWLQRFWQWLRSNRPLVPLLLLVVLNYITDWVPDGDFKNRIVHVTVALWIITMALWLFFGIFHFVLRFGWWGLLRWKAVYFAAFTPLVAVPGWLILHEAGKPIAFRHLIWWLVIGQGLAWFGIVLQGSLECWDKMR